MLVVTIPDDPLSGERPLRIAIQDSCMCGARRGIDYRMNWYPIDGSPIFEYDVVVTSCMHFPWWSLLRAEALSIWNEEDR